jgi:Transcriptional regulators
MVYDYENDILWASLKLARLIKGKMQYELKDYGITSDQWVILHFIYKKEGLNQKKLAEISYKDRTVIARILKILENKELIEKKVSYHDKREFLIYLTDKGKDLYMETLAVINQNSNKVNVFFSESKLEDFKSSLNELISYLK